jgi:hypothetical protein
MIATTSHRITATVAAGLISAGLLAGGAAITTVHTTNLADYGAAITADDATDHARAEGVPHMSENHHGNGNYFERMDGARADVNEG